jgi:polyadenylate-binding protein
MDPNHNPNLYVRGFSSDFTAEQMFSLFSQFGEVSSHVIMKDVVRGGGNRNFGFVCFKTPQMALSAIDGLNGKTIEGQTWYVTSHLRRELRRKKLEAEYREKQESWKRRDLFIKNLPSSMSESMLKQLCEEYGPIESVKIHMTENITYQGDVKVPVMVSKGSGFVCFVSEESAKKAYISLRNKMIDNKIIYVAMWKPREELLKNFNAKRFKMFNKQMMEFGAFNPMFGQQMRLPRGRAPQVMPQMPQMIPQMMPRMMQRPAEAHPSPPAHPAPAASRSSFDWAAFSSAPAETKRRMLGEQLYPVVLRSTNEKIAGKITGMLLEIEASDLIKLIQNPGELSIKIHEAIEVLRRAWAGNQQNLDLLPKAS